MKQLAAILVIVLATVACGHTPPQQSRAVEAQQAVKAPEKTNFNERRQIAEAETYLDEPGRIYWVHLLTDDGTLVSTVTCEGRPNSSTESLEPNHLHPIADSWVDKENYGFQVALEGGQYGYSSEAMGKDGTYGEPVPYRFCMTTTGHYFDFSQQWRYIVTDEPLVFPAPTVREDAQLTAKKLMAEDALRKGGCVDLNLNVIPCTGGK